MNIQNIKALPINTKILLGVAVLIAIALIYGILRTTFYSDNAINSRQAEADSARNVRILECEQQVEQKFYGEYNTKEYRQAMQECSRR